MTIQPSVTNSSRKGVRRFDVILSIQRISNIVGFNLNCFGMQFQTKRQSVLSAQESELLRGYPLAHQAICYQVSNLNIYDPASREKYGAQKTFGQLLDTYWRSQLNPNL